MGRISGTMMHDFFGMPGNGKRFDCQYCQVAFVENKKIKYIRDHWNVVEMYQQLGWDCSTLNKK
jgi:predicted ester cyclase